MKRNILPVVIILFLFTSACEEGSGPDPEIDNACSKMMQYCPTGYSWSDFVSTEAQCRDTYHCVYDFYSGNCRSTLVEGINCLSELTSETGCGACDTMLSQLMSTCDYPASCF